MNELIKFDNNELIDVFKEYLGEQSNNIRYTTIFDEESLFNALNGVTEKVSEYIGETITCVGIVITSANLHEDKNDETSPIYNKACVNIFTDDNKILSSVSNGIIKATESLLSISTLIPTPENPRKLKFSTLKTKKGDAHTFKLVK